jgi:hypothetical protein
MAIWLADLSLSDLYNDAQYNVPEFGDHWNELPEYLQQQVHEVDMAQVRAE